MFARHTWRVKWSLVSFQRQFGQVGSNSTSEFCCTQFIGFYKNQTLDRIHRHLVPMEAQVHAWGGTFVFTEWSGKSSGSTTYPVVTWPAARPVLLSLLCSIGYGYKICTVFRFCNLKATFKGRESSRKFRWQVANSCRFCRERTICNRLQSYKFFTDQKDFGVF